MIYALLIFLVATLTSVATPNKLGQLLLSDGTRLLPNASVPTPAEIVDAEELGADVWANGTNAIAIAETLESASADLETRVALLEGKGLLYGSCISFGSQSVQANTNVTAKIIGYNTQSNTTDKTYINIYVYYSDDVDNMGIEYSDNYTDGWESLTLIADELTEYQGAECYRMEVAVDKADEANFFRACGDFVQNVIGQFNVWDSFTVNGVSGLTTTNSIGIFIDGLLVEEMDLLEATGL